MAQHRGSARAPTAERQHEEKTRVLQDGDAQQRRADVQLREQEVAKESLGPAWHTCTPCMPSQEERAEPEHPHAQSHTSWVLPPHQLQGRSLQAGWGHLRQLPCGCRATLESGPHPGLGGGSGSCRPRNHTSMFICPSSHALECQHPPSQGCVRGKVISHFFPKVGKQLKSSSKKWKVLF